MPATNGNRRAARFLIQYPNGGTSTLAEYGDAFALGNGAFGALLGVDVSYADTRDFEAAKLLVITVGSKVNHRVMFTQDMIEELKVSLPIMDVANIYVADANIQKLHVVLHKRASVELSASVADTIIDYLGMDELTGRPWVNVHVDVKSPYEF